MAWASSVEVPVDDVAQGRAVAPEAEGLAEDWTSCIIFA